jgi:HEAT repeat protein
MSGSSGHHLSSNGGFDQAWSAPHDPVIEARARALVALQRALAGDDDAARCAAVRALERLDARDAKSVDALIAALRDPDADVRMDAAAALGRMQLAQAIEPLVGNLELDPEGEVRIEAARALGEIGSVAAVEPLIRCFRAEGYPGLGDQDEDLGDTIAYGSWWEVQSQSLEALGEIGDARAVDAVIEALAGEDGEALQEGALRVLARLGGTRASVYLLDQLKNGAKLARRRAARALVALRELRGAGAEFPSEFVQPLIDALPDADAGVRIEAARALAASGHPTAAVAITLLLTDRDVEVCKEAATLFAGLRAANAQDRLHGLLAESALELKKRVVRVLGNIGEAASVAPLAAWLDTDDEGLLYEVVCALGRIGRPGEEKRLAAILADPKRHHSVRAQAASALGRMLGWRDRAGKARDEQASAVQTEAVRMAEETLAAVVRESDERVSHAALCALVEMDPGSAPSRLVALIEASAPAPDPGQRGDEPKAEIPPELRDLVDGHSAQTSTLAAIYAAHAGQRPITGQDDGAPALSEAARTLAIRLLGNCVQPGTGALDALRRMCRAPESARRREALLALGRIGDRSTLDALLAGLEDEAREVRLGALDALARLSEVPDLAARLTALCDDPDAEVRVRAVSALAATTGPEVGQRLRRALADENMGVCRAALRALSPATYAIETRGHIVELVFRFSGELRSEAAATLRRLGDFEAGVSLLAALDDVSRNEWHCMLIDALGELYAAVKEPQ